jgi:hypothetical protein
MFQAKKNAENANADLPKLFLVQFGESSPDQILYQFFIDFPIDRDLKAVLKHDKLPQPHLKVVNHTRTPG